MWEVGAKQRNRPVRKWRNRSRVGLFRTVFVNAGGKPRVHLARNPSPAYAKSGRDRFDSWHFVRPFSLPSVEIWRGLPTHQSPERTEYEGWARGFAWAPTLPERGFLSQPRAAISQSETDR